MACEDARALSQALGGGLSFGASSLKNAKCWLRRESQGSSQSVENLGCFVELEVVLAPGEPAEQGHREAHDLLRSLEIPERALSAEDLHRIY